MSGMGIEKLVDDLVVQEMAAQLETAGLNIEALAHDDGSPRWEWIRRIGDRYLESTTEEERPDDLKIGSAAHAVLAIMRRPKKTYVVHYSDGSESTYMAATRMELASRIHQSAREARDGAHVDVYVSPGAGGIEYRGVTEPFVWWEKQEVNA